MKQKEIKNLAKKIATKEMALNLVTDEKERQKLENEIAELCSHVKTVEDMVALDEAVQDYF